MTAEQKERVRLRQREYYARPEVKERQRKYYASPEGKLRVRRYNLKFDYGMSPEQWDQMFLDQGSCCAICKSPDPSRKNGWHTDHCHATGRVRGILCHPCNTALGSFKDNPATLQNAITYITENK